MGNDMAKMAGLSSGPPKNKTGSSVVKKKVEAAAKTGVLSLTEHKLEKVPSVVVKVLGGSESKLRTLDLSANKLEDLPDFGGAFPKLKTCKLHKNRLRALPALGGALTSLDAGDNKLAAAGVEACLAAAAKLEDLRLPRNPFGGGCGPAALGALSKLRVLDVSDCGLTALLLFDGAAWAALVEVLADGNPIEALDDAFASRVPKLQRLSLERTRVRSLPASLLALKTLDRLDLKGCPISKKQFLELDGVDDFMKRREAQRKKEGGGADFGVCGLDDA